MAVFRVERTRDYTVMSNHHLKDRTLTLKAKGLLSVMLSLPDDWDYNTTRGLASICREGDAIGKAIKELENAGYMKRRQLRGKDGRITDFEARTDSHIEYVLECLDKNTTYKIYLTFCRIFTTSSVFKTLPKETTFPSITRAGVDITP